MNTQTVCSRRTSTCAPVWRLTGAIIHGGLPIIRLRFNKVREKNPSCWAGVTPRVDLVDPSVARAAEYEERPVKTVTMQNWPLNICLPDSGVWLHRSRPRKTHSGQPSSRIWLLFRMFGGLEDMLYSPLGQHIFKLRAPPRLHHAVIRYVRWLH